ncbi:MAG TPA: helix-turn-helix domain-containing protein [Terriglobia bacterium]|nr:helix-turn-helix domain-containing protein [Terriglobia bacterium]
MEMASTNGMSPREAAVQLHVGLAHVYHLLWAKKLPATRKNGRWFIPVDAIDLRLRAKHNG